MFNDKIEQPVFDLELRVQPHIRYMVQKMLLSEDEARVAIEEAVNSAVIAFDWRAQIRKEVEQTLAHEVRKVLENVGRRLLWDDEIFAQIKKSVVKALNENESKSGS